MVSVALVERERSAFSGRKLLFHSVKKNIQTTQIQQWQLLLHSVDGWSDISGMAEYHVHVSGHLLEGE